MNGYTTRNELNKTLALIRSSSAVDRKTKEKLIRSFKDAYLTTKPHSVLDYVVERHN